jgi:hypothetical protein
LVNYVPLCSPFDEPKFQLLTFSMQGDLLLLAGVSLSATLLL